VWVQSAAGSLCDPPPPPPPATRVPAQTLLPARSAPQVLAQTLRMGEDMDQSAVSVSIVGACTCLLLGAGLPCLPSAVTSVPAG